MTMKVTEKIKMISPGKIKAMGLDPKRSRHAPFMQDFLNELLLKTLTGLKEEEIIERIIEFRSEFRNMPMA